MRTRNLEGNLEIAMATVAIFLLFLCAVAGGFVSGLARSTPD
jgi:hypothetical protein